jgi:hypothetical protein
MKDPESGVASLDAQMPTRIKFHVHVRQSRFIEDAPPQHLLGRAFLLRRPH